MSRKMISAVLAAVPMYCLAQAAPLVLNVPVELKNLSFAGLTLSCGTGSNPNSKMLEGYIVKVPILVDANGNFSKTVRVPMPKSLPTDTFYRCELLTQSPSGGAVRVGPAMAQPGSPLMAVVTGAIKK
jgi:hypothetical protein